MSGLIEYIPHDTLFHKLNPITKVLWTFAVIILCFMTASPLVILAVFATNIVIASYSRTLKRIMPFIKGLFIFSLMLVLFQIFFVTEGETLFYILPSNSIGRITDTGLKLSAVMALRMLATVSTIPILITTTPMTDIVVIMVDRLKVPFKYAFMFTTALRFIPVFMSEMNQILQAQMSRGFNSDTKNPFRKFMIIVPLAVPLLVSSVKKTEKIAISMEVRGFGTGPRSYYREIKMQTADYAAVAFLVVSVLSGIAIKLI